MTQHLTHSVMVSGMISGARVSRALMPLLAGTLLLAPVAGAQSAPNAGTALSDTFLTQATIAEPPKSAFLCG